MISFNDEHNHNVALTGISAITELVQRLYESQKSQANTLNRYHETSKRVGELEKENADLKSENDSLKLQNSLGPRFHLTDKGKELACDEETGEED